MRYYLDVISQVVNSDSTIGEFGKMTNYATEDKALENYYSNLETAAKTKNYLYMSAKIFNSLGTEIKHDAYGKYQVEEPEKTNTATE